MAVTILEEPAAVALAYNPVLFKVEAEKLFPDGFAGVSNSEVVVGPVASGDWNMAVNDELNLEFNGQQFAFLFKATVSPTPFELPTIAIEGSTVAQSLKAFFETCHFITKSYTISTVNDWQVKFTAKEADERWDMNVSLSAANAVSWFLETNVAGVSPAYVANRYVRGDLYLDDGSGNFEFYAEIEQLIIDTDTLTFDFSSKMQAYFFRKKSLSNVTASGISQITSTNRRYYVIFTEYDAGGYEAVAESVKSTTQRVIKAGIKKDEWKIFNDPVSDYLKEKNKPLSWRSARRTLANAQQDLIYCLNCQDGVSSIKLKLKFYYSNGTDNTVLDEIVGSPVANATYQYLVDYTHLLDEATIPANESLRGVEIRWENQNDELLVESTFFKIVSDHALDRYFYYESSWGVMEVIRTQSRHSYGFNVKSEEVIVGATANYNDGGLRQIVDHYTEAFGGSSGNIESLQEALNLTDFIISDHKYLKKGTRLMNVIIEGGNYRPYEDDAYPYGFSFKYKRAEEQTKYSELIGVGLDDGFVSDSGDVGLTPG